MGCFLTMTRRDLGQLRRSMKAAVSNTNYQAGNQVTIQVSGVAHKNAKQMAALIRKHAPSAKVTSGIGQTTGKAFPTLERYLYTVAELTKINPTLRDLYMDNMKSARRSEMARIGKQEAEPVAAEVLQQSGYLSRDADVNITRSKGVDIKGSTITGNTVVAEVKFTGEPEDFGKKIDRAKRTYKDEANPDGYRQMSNGWLSKVAPDLDPEKANILGVQIDATNGNVTVYRRMDSEANNWKPLMKTNLSNLDDTD